MKKLFLLTAAFAVMLFTSCEKEEMAPAAKEATVTYTVELPSVQTKAGTQAIGNGFNVDQLVYEVWKTEAADERDLKNGAKATRLYQETAKMTKTDGEQKCVITLNLVHDQNYTILFWAQNEEAKAYNTSLLTEVTYAKTKYEYDSNNEDMAAFYGVEFLHAEEIEKAGAMRRTELKRPFAQLNIATMNTVEKDEYKVELNESKVRVSYVPTIFDVAKNTPTTPAVTDTVMFTFNYAALPQEDLTVNGKAYDHYVAMNYMFAPEGQGNVKVEYWIDATLIPTDVATNSSTPATIYKEVLDVPLKENYRTNIVGNLLTSTTQYEVVIDADFGNPEYVVSDEWNQTGNYTYTVKAGASAGTLKEILEHANAQAKEALTKSEGPVVTINLNGNVEWATGAGIGSTPLLPEDSPISAVVINGNGKTFTATGSGVGKVRLANGAPLTFNNLTIVDESKSYAENSWEYGYLEFGGNVAFNDCNVVNAIMMSGENAAFEGCTFNSNKDSEYDVWVDSGSASFVNCTFNGARGLKVHEAYGSEVVSVSVNECTFGPLTKKPGVAIGDLNSETSVSITNSVFNKCQAGDQGLFIYETDTDITTFTFVCENNIVIPSGDEYVVQPDRSMIVATAEGLKKAINDAVDGNIIRLADGKYDGLFLINKSITLKSLNAKGAEIAGRICVAGSTETSTTFENLVLSVSDNTQGLFTESDYYNKTAGYIIGNYAGNIVVENCTFNGMSDEIGAIYYYAHSSGATTNNLEKLTVNNCTFNGGRAIRSRSNVSVTNSTFSGLVNPCLQILGLGDTDVESNVVFTGNNSDVAVSGVCIKTSNYATKNITFNVAGNTNCNIISFDGKNVNNLFPETYTFTGEVKELCPEDGKALNFLLAQKVADIKLLPGAKYEGTFKPVVPTTFKSLDANAKAIIAGKVQVATLGKDINVDGTRFENIEFEINDLSKTQFKYSNQVYKYSAVVDVFQAAVEFEGCKFSDIYNSHNVVAINYESHAANKMLEVNNCEFQGYAYAIRSRALVSVTNSVFNHTHSSANPRAIFVWGLNEKGTTTEQTGNVIFTGNRCIDKAMFAFQMTATSFDYDNITINVQNNTGLVESPIMVNTTTCNYDNITFVEGSATFEY